MSQSGLLAEDIVELELEVGSGASLSIRHYSAPSSKLIIWLPSERGLSNHGSVIAENLADLGINVWRVDLHGSYMVSTSRYSLDTFPLDDIHDILNQANQQNYDEVFFLTAGRGAKLVLNSIVEYSSRFPASILLKGSILIHPNIFEPLSEMGAKARFISSSHYSHLPIYMIQAQYSTKFMYTNDMRRQLEKGGSQVFTHILNDVQGGFYARPPDDLNESSKEAKRRLPATIFSATRLLRSVKPAGLAINRFEASPQSSKPPVRATTLSPFKGDKQPPGLSLPGINGQNIDLRQYQGRVVLVNFWASWCSPCVEEIPSLSRLGRRFTGKPFDILTVNIGESSERVERFLAPLDAEFEVLLDEAGDAVRDWRVYAYPSNFLIDRNGQIQYAYRGALEWDSPEVVKVIEGLF